MSREQPYSSPASAYVLPLSYSATVAQTYNQFWVGVPSNPVQVVRRDVSVAAAPLPTPPNPGNNFNFASTRPPYVPPSYVAPNEVSISEDTFYDGCGQIKNCFGFPNGCVATKSCTSVTAVTVRGNIYEIEMRSGKGRCISFWWVLFILMDFSAGTNAAYVAMGLSDDAKMGEDLTTECVPENGRVNLYSSYTSANPYSAVRANVVS